MREYKVEMRVGQDHRMVKADSFGSQDGWQIFYRNPPQGGRAKEYWRVQVADVISITTNDGG